MHASVKKHSVIITGFRSQLLTKQLTVSFNSTEHLEALILTGTGKTTVQALATQTTSGWA